MSCPQLASAEHREAGRPPCPQRPQFLSAKLRLRLCRARVNVAKSLFSISNIQHPFNMQLINAQPLNIGCWLLNEYCVLIIGYFPKCVLPQLLLNLPHYASSQYGHSSIVVFPPYHAVVQPLQPLVLLPLRQRGVRMLLNRPTC